MTTVLLPQMKAGMNLLLRKTLFQRRYEEGYNLYIDADYIRWLRLHHLEVNISNPTKQDSGSLSDAFPDITPVPIESPED